MFTTFAQTFFRASGVSPTRYHKEIPQSWYREDLRPDALRPDATTGPKRWEDWK